MQPSIQPTSAETTQQLQPVQLIATIKESVESHAGAESLNRLSAVANVATVETELLEMVQDAACGPEDPRVLRDLRRAARSRSPSVIDVYSPRRSSSRQSSRDFDPDAVRAKMEQCARGLIAEAHVTAERQFAGAVFCSRVYSSSYRPGCSLE